MFFIKLTNFDFLPNQSQPQTLPPMSSFRGSATGPGGSQQPSQQGQNSPGLYSSQQQQQQHPQHSQQHPQHPQSSHQQHSQHSPAIQQQQNDTIVGKAIRTMYTTADQSISSYSSNPSTPVNSPPPLTSSQQPQQAHPPTHPLHPSSSGSQASTWQQLTPVINGGAGGGGASSSTSINGMQPNGSYTPEMVPRGIHMVSAINLFAYLFLKIFLLLILCVQLPLFYCSYWRFVFCKFYFM